MSVAVAKDFLAEISQNEEFRNKVMAAPDDDKRREIVQAAGYTFSKADIESAMNDHAGELSDDELESVAGGGAGKVSFVVSVVAVGLAA